MRSIFCFITVFILLFTRQKTYSQTIGIMDNGQPALPSTINSKLIKAVTTADVIVCDTMHGDITPANGFKAVCFNVISKSGAPYIDGFGVVLSGTVSASDYLQIYKRPGLVAGKNLSSAGWSFLDSIKVYKANTVSDTLFVANLSFSTTINMLNKDTVGIFVGFRNTGPLTLKYENTPTFDAVWNQDVCIELRTGYGGAALFNAAQSPRVLGGYVKYCCLPGLGIIEQKKELGLEIFPNPASDFITIKVDTKHFYIEVYNVLGEIVLRERSLSPMKNIDVRNLPSGTYTLKLVTDSKKMTRKQFIVNR